MRQPQVFSALEMSTWANHRKYKSGAWVPDRPLPFSGTLRWSMIRMRLFCAWQVFTGKYDALNWNDR